MTSLLNLACSGFVFFTLFQVSQGFVRYALLSTTDEPQWSSDTLCKNSDYDGLAVIDSPAKWEYAKVVLSSLSTDSKAWIGLEYTLTDGEPKWLGDAAVYTWGAWGSNQPDWSSTSVLVSHDGSNWVWEVSGSNYLHYVLCYRQFNNMGLSRYPNDNVNLASATPKMSVKTITTEDCAVTCASLSSCDYLTYDKGTEDCKMYDAATVSPLLTSNADTANSFSLYSVRA